MKRPNILILHTDQQRWDALGVNGNPDIITPNLDRLAQQGLNFDNHYVQNPVCMPSRVSMLTSQYPSDLGILRNGVPVPEDTITLPTILHNYGYTSGNVGKLHFLPHANRDHRSLHPRYGFDHMEVSDEPGCYEDVYRAWVRRKAPDQLDHISRALPPAARVYRQVMGDMDDIPHPERDGDGGYQVGVRVRADVTQAAFVAEQTMEYIRQHQAGPFFCIAGIYAPHSPGLAPQEYMDMYDPDALTLPAFPSEIDAQRRAAGYDDAELAKAHQAYYAMVTEVDHQVGRILDYVDELGIADETIVIFTSDHGEWLGEHERYGKGYPAHDCISRTPLLVRWPQGIADPGRTIHEFVEAVDVVPTLLEVAAIPITPHLQGQSFAAALEGDAAMRDSALTEGEGWKTLRLPGLRYVVERDGSESLFDLEADPDGYHNVAADPAYADALYNARHHMLRRLLAKERPLPRPWAY